MKKFLKDQLHLLADKWIISATICMAVRLWNCHLPVIMRHYVMPHDVIYFPLTWRLKLKIRISTVQSAFGTYFQRYSIIFTDHRETWYSTKWLSLICKSLVMKLPMRNRCSWSGTLMRTLFRSFWILSFTLDHIADTEVHRENNYWALTCKRLPTTCSCVI